MSIFLIGMTGVNTAQIALNTTANNISNVYTPGYNRELILLQEKAGGGAQVVDIQRQFDYFISTQLNNANAAASSLQSYQWQIGQIDNILADQEAGLAPLIQKFFSSLGDLAGAPSDPAARQGVIGSADTLTAQFRSLDAYLQSMQDGISQQINGELVQVNNILQQIAKLNQEVIAAKAKVGGAPNNLLNQRDQLVSELSNHLDVRIHVQDGGSYNITIANGLPLVSGGRHFELVPMGAAADPSRMVVGYQDSAGNRVELQEHLIQGGTLGGLMGFRAETLDQVQNQVGLMSVVIAESFNELHQQGLDLNGVAGERFFSTGQPQVVPHASNAGAAGLSAVFGDVSELTGRDYQLRVVSAADGEFQISQLGGGGSVTLTVDADGNLHFDGLTINVDDVALLQDGDRYLLQPVRRAANQFDNLVNDTGKIAASLEGGSGDNRNALALQALQDARVVRGHATISQAYAALVSDVGNRTSIVQINLAAQTSLTEQIRGMQQAGSGVNLDEEAANLIRFQQYYQASAKVIEVGTTILDTMLRLR